MRVSHPNAARYESQPDCSGLDVIALSDLSERRALLIEQSSVVHLVLVEALVPHHNALPVQVLRDCVRLILKRSASS
jgi:hypothetical protein